MTQVTYSTCEAFSGCEIVLRVYNARGANRRSGTADVVSCGCQGRLYCTLWLKGCGGGRLVQTPDIPVKSDPFVLVIRAKTPNPRRLSCEWPDLTSALVGQDRIEFIGRKFNGRGGNPALQHDASSSRERWKIP